MSRVISEEIEVSSGQGGKDLAVAAYKRTRFGSDPVQGSALPDGNAADAMGTAGHDGVVILTLPTDETYCLTWMDGSVRDWRIVLGSSPYKDVDHGLPSGGTTGQVPAKASDADYDYHLVTPSGGGSTKLVDLGGDGSDGAVVLDGVTTNAFSTLAGTVYTLTRNAQVTSVSVSGGASVVPAGFSILLNEFAAAVKARMALFFPEDYGAVADGVTNDHVALTDALTAAGLVKGVVWLRPGKDYHTNTTLELPHGVNVQSVERDFFGDDVFPSGTISGAAGIDVMHITGDDTWATDNDNTLAGVLVQGGANGIVADQNLGLLTLRFAVVRGQSHAPIYLKGGGLIRAQHSFIGTFPDSSPYGVLVEDPNGNGFQFDGFSTAMLAHLSAFKYTGAYNVYLNLVGASWGGVKVYNPTGAAGAIFDLAGPAAWVEAVSTTFRSTGTGGDGPMLAGAGVDMEMIGCVGSTTLDLTGHTRFCQIGGGFTPSGAVVDPGHVYTRVDGKHLDNPPANAAGDKAVLIAADGTLHKLASAAAIASPTSDTVGTKAAIDALIVAVRAAGVTL